MTVIDIYPSFQNCANSSFFLEKAGGDEGDVECKNFWNDYIVVLDSQ
jgi:hypothetical protein